MNPKNKGNTFERKISKLLSERFRTHTGIDNSFRRNIDSGSFFGGSNQHRASSYDTTKATFGDIVCPESFRFNLECKHYKSAPTFNSLLKQDFKQWDTWLSQAEQDSKNSGLAMMLIVKYNGVEEFVFVHHAFAGLQPLFHYKSYRGFSLKTILAQPDSEFFS